MGNTKLQDLPEAVQKQMAPTIRGNKKLTTEQRREAGKKAWLTRLENARKKAQALSPEEIAKET